MLSNQQKTFLGKKLQTLAERFSHVEKEDTWLDNLNASEAFVACIGAGPWKLPRRIFIQRSAIENLRGRDLSEVSDLEPLGWFPLDWQFSKTTNMVKWLRNAEWTMWRLCRRLENHGNPIQSLKTITKTKGRAKVLDLFIRDYLKCPAFPIDRHVASVLKQEGLPLNEWELIQACHHVGIKPQHLSKQIAGEFVQNPKHMSYGDY